TAILARLDLGTGMLEYVTAGHPPATVLCRDGSATTRDGGRRLPLGMDTELSEMEAPNMEIPAAGHVQLRRGDRVLFHTDGVTDARNAAGEFYDSQRLIDHARLLHGEDETVPETARKLTQQVVDSHDGPPQDDLTVVVCEWSSTAAEEMLP
ncbi:MAG: serine/threonine-protein phosphatase, partial [Catenulispora sp.]|nr:serine/threonine-protein phosphatase [Catenulispora sp.]